MSVGSIQAGKKLCVLSGWNLSNLRLQKLLYIAHMYHLAEMKEELINEKFEAWMYGPVEPVLYQYVKGYGKKPIPNIFHPEIEDVPEGSELDYLQIVIDHTKEISNASLVSFTHWSKGAWFKKYNPRIRGNIIPNDLIVEEYNAR